MGAAIAEMFNTGHVRMLREACRLERLLLAAVHLETNSRCGGQGLLARRSAPRASHLHGCCIDAALPRGTQPL